jgi:hypothetical protein
MFDIRAARREDVPDVLATIRALAAAGVCCQ